MTVPRILIVSPTKKEMDSFLTLAHRYKCPHMVCGLGPGSTSFELTRFIESKGAPSAVILAGVAGAYQWADVELEDVCLASSEVYGDLGRHGPSGIEPISLEGDETQTEFALEPGWRQIIKSDLVKKLGLRYGPMVTVSCVTGTRERARDLRERFKSIAENMEGAAAAQVCNYYHVPLLEFRGISNWVGDLDKKNWRLNQALSATAKVLEKVLGILLD
ncbi:MAG: futalosine hydrolase [Deltaproteobacteria bacterium]|nr:futalosine hydrolase [Deltaproteobacteria bacterium]